MEDKETFTNDSDFAHVFELEKKLRYLEYELLQANVKLASVEELLLLTEKACDVLKICDVLREQVSSLLSSVQRFVSETPISRLPLVDVATQCDGEWFSLH